MNFPGLKDKYTNDLSDGWGAYTMIVAPPKRKKIVYDYSDTAPAVALSALEDMIDEAARRREVGAELGSETGKREPHDKTNEQ